MSVLNPHPERKGTWATALLISTAMHAAAGVYALDVIPFGAPQEDTQFAFPDIAISNIALQEQQLAALEPDIEATDATEDVETPAEPEAEQLDATEPEAEAVDAAEAETLEAAEPEAEELAAVAPDTAEAIEPETLDAEPVEAETLEAAEPDVADVTETVEAVEPDAPEVAAVEQVETANPVLTPVLPDESSTLQGAVVEQVAPAAAAAPVVQTVRPTDQIVTAANTVTRIAPVGLPPRPEPAAQPAPPPPPPPPSPEELALAELIERIKNRFGDTCLIALPQNQGPGQNPLVTVLSDQDRTMATFVDEVLSDPDLPVDTRQVLVDERQCAALDFARAQQNYPTFRIKMTLESRLIASGDRLNARLEGVAGRNLAVMIVDSNGVVQDLRDYTRATAGSVEVSVPVNVNGAQRDTSQLLIAVASRGRLTTLRNLSGRLAEDFYDALSSEIGAGAIIAVLPFDVR